MGKERIEQMFASVRDRERPGLIVFLTAGFPDMEATLELVPALVAAGADAVELGVPFSDPLAEGPTIQQSSFLALENGVTTADCLQAAETLRDRIPDAPLILMGYYNPVYSYGIAPFAAECRRVGVDGLITIDLPGTESGPLAVECDERDISLIPLLAPDQHGGKHRRVLPQRQRIRLLRQRHRRHRRKKRGFQSRTGAA